MNIRDLNRPVFISLIIASFILACEPNNKVDEVYSEGRMLAERHCQSCHLLPEPEELDLSTWKYTILPNMSERLGIETGRQGQLENLKELGLFPPSPALSVQEYNKIKNYYSGKAPFVMVRSEGRGIIDTDLSLFEISEPDLRGQPPFSSLVKIDTSTGRIYYGNARTRTIYELDFEGALVDSIQLEGAPSFLHREKDTFYWLAMGDVMPHDRAESQFGIVQKDKDRNFGSAISKSKNLRRAVHASIGDINRDGERDVLISCFGNNLGQLTWLENSKGGEYTQHILNSYPGTIKSDLIDINSDGLLDIISLVAQGDEKLLFYLNNGNGSFDEKTVLRFPSTYGSTYFDFLDFTGDGTKDILYVNGDNGDYRPILKNYHGIRLYEGDDESGYKLLFFLPMYGAFKASARDFDKDGDLDIAAISYFPDYASAPEESFIYFENIGDYNFERSTFSNSQRGKWLVMDTGDWDGDGDEDIVLGSSMFLYSEGSDQVRENWARNASPILLMENQIIRQSDSE